MKAISEDNIMQIKESLITLELKSNNTGDLFDESLKGLKAVRELFESSIEGERVNAADVKFLLNLVEQARESAKYPISRAKALEIRNLLDGIINRLKGAVFDVMELPMVS